MNWKRVYPTDYCPCLFRHTLMLTSSWFGSVMAPCGSLWSWGNKATLLSVQQGSLFNWVQVFCIKVDDSRSSKNLTWRGAYPFHTPNGLAAMTQFHVSSHGGHSVCCLMASTGQCLFPLPNAPDPVDIHFHYTLPEFFPHPSVDAPVDVHPWEKS